MFEKEKTQAESKIRDLCSDNDFPIPKEFNWNQIPFSGEWGISTSFFQLAADEARSSKSKIIVPQRAQEIAAKVAEEIVAPKAFSRIEAVKGYLNLYFSAPQYSANVLKNVLDQEENYGRGAESKLRYMIEFSQPNTHKAFHVGHLRNLILGDALAKIIEFSGIEVVRANYIGDFGKDVFKWIWNYQASHANEKPPKIDVTRWMGDLYAEATKKLEEDPNGEAEILDLLLKWEEGDPDVRKMWEETRKWSLDGFDEIYKKLDVSFDRIYYESEVEKPGKEIVNKLIDQKIAIDERDENGPVIVKLDELLGLEEEKYRVLVLLRSDSSSLYGAWDLALALKKFEEYELDKSIYVVDVRQSLHFQQVFKTLELAGYEELISKVFHQPYEVVNLPGNLTMSSREGVVVLLEDFIREATNRSEDVVVEKNPDLDSATRKEVGQAVGLGSIKFPMLARENTKIATFDWESALDLHGQAAPYIQYAHVRASSILRRNKEKFSAGKNPSHELNQAEIELIDLISQFPVSVQRAAEEYKTLNITNYAYSLAKAFNDFYNQSPVIKAEKNIKDFRLQIVKATKITISNSLKLLGIQSPEMM
jgi:arginyl-tRNA synthetase